MRKTMETRWIVLCGMFAALTAAGAFIQIPVPFMDYFTLQFLFVLLAGMLLGPRYGSISMGIYVLVGLAGVPVFAAGGGIQYMLRPSFGYLIGFIAGAWITGILCGRQRREGLRAYLPAAFAGMAVTYLIGFSYKYMILNTYLGQKTPFAAVILSAFPLDLPGDALLCVAASAFAERVKAYLGTDLLGEGHRV
ncbi:Substrate-specific component BioY of biotin ECF transporter [Anaerostipes rhamnosivorans]|uniref:Biotin transporter n=2 Tax=Anaerostipes rhamnosivorans TaxID=1229621 RepID=A0A4P8INJ7_9FIRM|nr:Substrate-specific component BioY of biotin ECF transporter [Anaerostipes rhamnosivorans]